MASTKKSTNVQVREINDQRDRPVKSRQPATKHSKSLFTVTNGQSISSQLSDANFVLRWMIRTTLKDPSPTAFARRYVVSPHRKNDRFVVSFGYPALSATPRVLDDAPSVRSSAGAWQYDGTRTAREHRKVLNVASYNYLGFVDLNVEDKKMLECAVRYLPLADDGKGCNQRLEDAVKQELRDFLGLPGCVLTASGYAINLLAFPAMAASSVGNTTAAPILLMDSESHSSMLVGAFIAHAATGAQIVKFRHNDMTDLRAKLEDIRNLSADEKELPSRQVWIAIEGLYSMDGTVPPLPEIVALKREYGFRIYIDEAHSILSIGSAGTGVVGYFQDTDRDSGISSDDIDMLGGTLSKSLSSVGGFVVCSSDLTRYLEARSQQMAESGNTPIPTLSVIRTMQILRDPVTIRQRLTHLRDVSHFVSSTLVAKGYRVSTTPGAPICAIIFDNVKRVLDFLRIGRESGLLCCGAAYPAAPRGAPRVRLSLTGAHTWEDVDEMLRLIDDIAKRVGAAPKVASSKVSGAEAPRSIAIPNQKEMDSVSSLEVLLASARKVNDAIRALCPEPFSEAESEIIRLRQAGVEALSKYGLGAAGPRWMYGTSSSHLQLECQLNNAVRRALPRESTSGNACDMSTTLFTDASVGLLSIISVCMEPLTPRRAQKGERHLVFLPSDASLEVKEGIAVAQRHTSTRVEWYDSAVARLSGSHLDGTAPTKAHATIFVEAGDCAMQKSSMISLLQPFESSGLHSLTVIIADSHALPTSFSSSRAHLHELRLAVPDAFESTKIQWILFSPLHTMPGLPGLQGAFCTGSRRLVEKIQFLGPGVMYTAMMAPVTAVLAESALRQSAKFVENGVNASLQ